jgi:hypothetical protein
MNIYRNEKLIKRNARIAQIGLVVTLAILVGGMLLAFQRPEEILLSYGILIVGFILFQITVYFQNRWGRKPRPDMMLDAALKGLDKRNSLYHYLSPVNHLLVGPNGIWVLLPFYQRGTIRFENGRYKQTGRSLYWKIFGQEGLGRPELEIEADKASMDKFLKERFPDQEFPRIEAVLVFTDPRTVVDIPSEAEPPAATIPIKELKEVIRKGGKSKSIAIEKIKLLEDELPKE